MKWDAQTDAYESFTNGRLAQYDKRPFDDREKLVATGITESLFNNDRKFVDAKILDKIAGKELANNYRMTSSEKNRGTTL